MDVQEVRKLDGYLKKLFGNAQIRVVPKGRDNAEIFVGPDDLGELTVDDEDGERSYNFRMVIQVSSELRYEELMKVVEVCAKQKLPDGKPLSKLSFVEVGGGGAGGGGAPP